MGLEEYWLEMEPEGESVPDVWFDQQLAHEAGCSPSELREWDAVDVLDLWDRVIVEGRMAAKHRKELERDRIR